MSVLGLVGTIGVVIWLKYSRDETSRGDGDLDGTYAQVRSFADVPEDGSLTDANDDPPRFASPQGTRDQQGDIELGSILRMRERSTDGQDDGVGMDELEMMRSEPEAQLASPRK